MHYSGLGVHKVPHLWCIRITHGRNVMTVQLHHVVLFLPFYPSTLPSPNRHNVPSNSTDTSACYGQQYILSYSFLQRYCLAVDNLETGWTSRFTQTCPTTTPSLCPFGLPSLLSNNALLNHVADDKHHHNESEEWRPVAFRLAGLCSQSFTVVAMSLSSLYLY